MGTLLKDYIKSIADSYRVASGTTDLVKGIDLPSKIAELTSKDIEPEYTLTSIEGSNSAFGYSERFIALRVFPSILDSVDLSDAEVKLMHMYKDSRDIGNVDYSLVELLRNNFTTFNKDVDILTSPLSSVIDENVLKSWISEYVPEGTKINFIHNPNEVFSTIIMTDNDIDFESMLSKVVPSETEKGNEDSYTVLIPEGLYKFNLKGDYYKNEEIELAAGEITRGAA